MEQAAIVKLEFGDYAKLIKLSVSWRKLDPQVLYSMVQPATIINWIRKGKAAQAQFPWSRQHRLEAR